MRITRRCMEPMLADRSKAVFSKTAKWAAGDLVVIWLRPEILSPGQSQAGVKRLVRMPPQYVKAFPHREHPESEVAAVLMVETINPPQRYMVRCDDFFAVHKLVGVVDGGAPIS
jgi:hypothetical protein